MADGSLTVLDGTGQKQKLSTTVDAEGSLVGSTAITDPASGAKQAIGQQHNSDGQTIAGNAAVVAAIDLLFDGTALNRRRGNVDTAAVVTMNASTAGTLNSGDLANYNHRGMQLVMNLGSNTASVTVAIQGKDAASSQYYTILQSAAIMSPGLTRLIVYPGLTATTNVIANDVLPRTFKIVVTITGGGAVTGTVGLSMLV